MTDWRGDFCELCRSGNSISMGWHFSQGMHLLCSAPSPDEYINSLRKQVQELKILNQEDAFDALLDEYIAEEREGRLRAEKEIARLQALLDQVNDVLVINWIPVENGDYRKALHALIEWNIQIHDDPQVSATARKRQEELEALQARVQELEAEVKKP